jgi:hypothetical protein
MTITDIIERGYFPKELPPPFNTLDFAKNISVVLHDWNIIFRNNTDVSGQNFVLPQNPGETQADFRKRKKAHRDTFIAKYNSSKGAVYSISKGKLSRRFLQIPNPKHFALLAEKIEANWIDFENIYNLSNYSKSRPVPDAKRSVTVKSKGVANFRSDLLNISSGKRILVKVDISKFYPTIYTHTIAWALLGKNLAKSYFKQKANIDTLIAQGDLNAALFKASEGIDAALRNCQERQSIGIPIGPDTSHIISEAIACRIDNILESNFSGIGLKAARYFDDYFLYVSSKDEADKVLKGLQLILNDFQLEINESKVQIKEFPFSIEDDFAYALFQFEFKVTNLTNSLKHYFSLVWGCAEKNPKNIDTIFKYSLRVFEFKTITIHPKSWKVFEDLLLKSALLEPSILDIVTRILLTYQSYIDADSKTKLKDLICNIINEHSLIKHNFEISWILWIAKTFQIEIEEETANVIINTKDSIANLILLDLIKNTTLVKGNPQISNLEADLKDDILFSENWLLAYESVKKGWLTPVSPTLLDDNLFFKKLKDLNIEFYNPVNQLTTYTIQGQQGTSNTSTQQYESLNINTKDTKDTNTPSVLEKSKNNIADILEIIPSGFVLNEN